jgi:phage anti-repressor protein
MDNYIEIIQNYYQSGEPFPVEFDLVWQWCGYSTKGNAKRILEDNFTQSTDYQVFIQNDKNPKGGRPTEQIKLTTDCAKSFAMLAQTENGKIVRNYFLQCEKALEAINKPKSLAQMFAVQAQINLQHEQRLLSLENKTSEIEAKISTRNENYYSIYGYGKLHKQTISPENQVLLSVKARKLSAELGIEVMTAHDSKLGEIAIFDKSILRMLFGF